MVEHPQTAVPFWRDVRVLTVISQIVFVIILAFAAGFFYNNLSTAMRQRGLVAGFEFLNRESGFEIGESLIDYKPSDTYGRAFMVGVLNSLSVSIVGIILATILGIITGVARLSSNWLLAKIAAVYIEIIRNTPLLVQLVFIYFGVFVKLPPVRESINVGEALFANQRGVFVPRPIPSETFPSWLLFLFIGLIAGIILIRVLTIKTRRAVSPYFAALIVFGLAGILGWMISSTAPLTLDFPVPGRFNFSGGLALSPEFSALLTGLVIYTAAFIAEVVRGGIQAVRKGQIEAAHALGLGEMQILRLITFPQAMRVIVPPLTSQYLNLAKNSSLAIAIGYPDLFNVGATIMNQTGAPVPVIMLVMLTYLAMSLFTSLLMNIYNRSVQIIEK
ncbi:MAG: ABC transporter permease subunit [Chloroflexi bacterium]|nr:ABC transporter permease subunit [Chloroflexota bacterium]